MKCGEEESYLIVRRATAPPTTAEPRHCVSSGSPPPFGLLTPPRCTAAAVCQMWIDLSSEAEANIWGSAGFHATLLTVPLWPSRHSSRSPGGCEGRRGGEAGMGAGHGAWGARQLHCCPPHYFTPACLVVHVALPDGTKQDQHDQTTPAARRTRLPVVHVHTALLAARQHKPVVQAAQAGAHHKAALLVLQQQKGGALGGCM